ncbi:MAG: hypothetical protein P1P72_07795 [ANME-2 cluster archaeon]|nr:hypothetical protein [ANME-2 cluster archaeon]
MYENVYLIFMGLSSNNFKIDDNLVHPHAGGELYATFLGSYSYVTFTGT